MENKKVLIIAEAGVNHNGNIELARKLIDIAVDCGVDIVKFQTFKSENLVTKSASMANYQVENIGKNDSQLAMLKKLELKKMILEILRNIAKKKTSNFSPLALI